MGALSAFEAKLKRHRSEFAETLKQAEDKVFSTVIRSFQDEIKAKIIEFEDKYSELERTFSRQ